MRSFPPPFSKITFPPSRAVPRLSEEVENLQQRLDRETGKLMRLRAKQKRIQTALNLLERQVDRTRHLLEKRS